MRRRHGLAFLLWTGLVASLPLGLAQASRVEARSAQPSRERPRGPSRPHFPSVALFGAHVGEALAYQPRDERGRVKKDAAQKLERLLRCRQTGQRHRLNPQLGEALYQIGRHFAGHRVSIYSGFRPRAFCTRAHSRHMTGSAIDFHVEGVRNEDLVAYLRRTFHPVGVGYYPHGVHVHLDVERASDAYWVDAGPSLAVEAGPEELVAVETPSLALPRPHDTVPGELEVAPPPDAPVAAAASALDPVGTADEGLGEDPAEALPDPPSGDPGLGVLPRLEAPAVPGE